VGEVGGAYAMCRARIGGLTAGLDEAAAGAPVPTCPDWTVHDVVAHVTGVVADVLAGKLDGVATDPWTAAQVAARRDRPVADILAEWDENAPAFEALLDDVGDPGRQAVADVATHEHDIRLALGRPGARDSAAVLIGHGFLAPLFVQEAAERGTPLRLVTAGGATYGAAAAPGLAGDPFQLLRAISGRRSLDQLREMPWDGDPEPAFGAFTYGPFHPAATRIDE
jgi:uncharacterized protein (TIGR03083 family)